MYAKCNIDACACHHCCSGKSVSITHSWSVFVNLAIQHAMRVRATIVAVENQSVLDILGVCL